MSAPEDRRHVLVWVAAEFLESEGMLHILNECGTISAPAKEWEKIVEGAEDSGGYAIAGKLVDPNHGAGIWISPLHDPGLEIMIPWHFVRSVVTAQEQHQIKTFGLARDGFKQQPVPPPSSKLPAE